MSSSASLRRGRRLAGFPCTACCKARSRACVARREEGQAAGSVASWYDGNLLDLVVVRHEGSHNGVAGLVERHELLPLLSLLGGSSLLLEAHHDAVDGGVDLHPANGSLALPSGKNGCLIEKVLKAGSREARSPPGDSLEVDVGLDRLTPGVDLEDARPAVEVW